MFRSLSSRAISLTLTASLFLSLAACSREEAKVPLFVSSEDSCRSTPVLVSSEAANLSPVVYEAPSDERERWDWAFTKADTFVAAIQAEPLDIPALHMKYGNAFRDVFFAHALASRLAPREVVALLKRVSDGNKSSDHDSRANQRAFLADLGSFITLSLGGSDLSEQAAPAQALLASSIRVPQSTPAAVSPLNEHIDKRVQDYADLLLLDDTTTYSDRERHARELTTTLVTETLAVAGESNPQLIIGPRVFSPDLSSGGLSLAEIFILADRSERSPLLLSDDWPQRYSSHGLIVLSDAPTQEPADHMLRDLLTAHLDAARSFFSRTSVVVYAPAASFRYPTIIDSDVPSEHVARIGITRFLTGHQHQSPEGRLGFPDCGEAYGKLIADLSAPPALLDGENITRDANGVSIARQFLVGYQEALDREHTSIGVFNRVTDKVKGQDLFSYTNPRLRSWAGVVLSRHIEGLLRYVTFATLNIPDDAPASPLTGRRLLAFNAAERAAFSGANGVFSDLIFDQPAPKSVRPRGIAYEIQYEGGRPPATALIMREFWRFVRDSFGDTPVEKIESTPSEELETLSKQYTAFFSAFTVAPINSTPEAHQAAIDFHIFNYSAQTSLIVPLFPHEVTGSNEDFLSPDALETPLPSIDSRAIMPDLSAREIASRVVAINSDAIFSCLYYENVLSPQATDSVKPMDLPDTLRERVHGLPQSCLDLTLDEMHSLQEHANSTERNQVFDLIFLIDLNTSLVVPSPAP